MANLGGGGALVGLVVVGGAGAVPLGGDMGKAVAIGGAAGALVATGGGASGPGSGSGVSDRDSGIRRRESFGDAALETKDDGGYWRFCVHHKRRADTRHSAGS